jgi:putative nucleotidyltransferase with HDIG domain
MGKKLKNWFTQSAQPAFEWQLRKRTLATVLWGVMLIGIILGLQNIFLHLWTAACLLFGLSILCILGLEINDRDHYFLVSLATSISILVIIFYILAREGGIHNPAVLAYPLIISVGSLLLGKRAAPIFFLAGCGSLILIGLLEMNGILNTSFSASIQDLITQIVLMAAEAFLVWITIDNVEVSIKHAEKSEEQLRESYDKTLEGWAKALEYRDHETEGHSRRVTSLSVQLAMELGLPDREITDLYRGALLHDIGKMAIPDSILFKPGPLNELEWELMRMHPIFAKEMLEEIPYLGEAISIVYYHHERWDGNGYPVGLQGEEIPLTSRIFTIVDHWEALSSDRPYRRALPQEKILEYIRENSGIIYDPKISEVFLNMMGSAGLVFDLIP